MKEYRDSYRKKDRIKFKKNAYKYLYRNTKQKTIGGLCDHLHITRQSLCKYKNKGEYWKNTVNDIKIFLELFNMLEIRGEMDVSAEGIDKIIAHLERIIEIRRYDYVKDDKEDEDQESNEQININPINYDEMEKYEEDGVIYYEDGDGNLYYPNE